MRRRSHCYLFQAVVEGKPGTEGGALVQRSQLVGSVGQTATVARQDFLGRHDVEAIILQLLVLLLESAVFLHQALVQALQGSKL